RLPWANAETVKRQNTTWGGLRCGGYPMIPTHTLPDLLGGVGGQVRRDARAPGGVLLKVTGHEVLRVPVLVSYLVNRPHVGPARGAGCNGSVRD
ncbi:hypothetical protein ACFXKC_55280, partial [Streptomyces sp. NPDC059340]|uniref:hypothetical protein n=1 Tax=Streptomyces sp. NPDC059340 TaxID=3346806 RepID=UPI0036CC861A